MSDQTLYDEDILLWSERQAEVIRRLRETVRGLPNDLDIENVAEEIESVGRSELAAVKSYLRLILGHLIKLLAEESADAAAHWEAEIIAFHAGLLDHYVPSMRQRIDMDALWRVERRRMIVDAGREGSTALQALPTVCPILLDDLIGEPLDSATLVERLKRAVETG